MKYPQLRRIQRLYFGIEEIARTLGITPASAKVIASRYVKQGLLVRLKRNLYVISERWLALNQEQKFCLANLIQVPSYISLMTALDYYEITTQIQQGFIESISIKRTVQKEIEGLSFRYTKIQRSLYRDFVRTKGFFIATPEKAFVDAVYLQSLGRYSFDVASIDFDKLDSRKIERLRRLYPLETLKFPGEQ